TVCRFSLSQFAPVFLARDMPDDRNMRVCRARREVLRHRTQIAIFPRRPNDWGERITLTRSYLQDIGKLALDNEQALFGNAIVDHYRFIFSGFPFLLDELFSLDLIAHGPD